MELEPCPVSAGVSAGQARRKGHMSMNQQNRMAITTLISGILAASFLALLIGWSVFDIISDIKRAAVLKARNHEVTSALNKLQINLTNAEKSERGYVVGSEVSATPYLAAVEEVRWTTDLIHALVSNDSSQRSNAARLEKLVESKLGTLQFVVEAREASSIQAAQLLMSVEQDKLETDRIKDVLSEMESHENTVLNKALRIRDGAFDKLWWVLAALTFMLFAGAIWQYLRVRKIVQYAAKSEAAIRHLANHDVLTELPNRRLLLERLDTHIDHAHSNAQSLAVMFMDLDGFKKVNDTIGHDAGDELLKCVAQRLKSTIRASDTVARIGGDEFIVVVPKLYGADTAAQIATTLVDAVSRPYCIKGRSIKVSTSIGISFYPKHGVSSGELLERADQALNQAKASGKNRYRFAS
ncbi:diguanylate cyclase domain-containing protein [Noviherbaspirillum saxi]|uniref:Diguanylate cyclase n=1 Tax=Noviherbaspirillum saxi TaxID=2320863 RepID=A0A3A3G5A0_9BURK|nr:diguanylate cyclase [Noviherbaspirillum saxi]RJF97305.1 diguanylate cyclase [Noviherbaspirillum saxi]